MKKLIVVLYLLNSCSFIANAQVIQQWEGVYNGTANSEDYLASSTFDKFGKLLVTGSSTGSNTEYDYLTIKYKSNGDTLWTRRFNGADSADDQAYWVTTDNSGNVLVTGQSSQDICTIKYDSSGNFLWEMRYNDNSFWCTGISVLTDDSGNVYVLGYSIGNSDKYITIKYNSQGSTQWVRKYENSIGGWSTSFWIDDSANVYVSGISSLNGQNDDIIIIKYSSSGDSLWVRSYDSGLYDYPFALAGDKAGNVYVTGTCDGTPFAYTAYNYLTLKYDANGNLVWARKYNGLANNRDNALALIVDDDFNVYVTGESIATGASSDYVTIKYNSHGDSLWVRRYNGTGNNEDVANSLTLDLNGDVYVAGSSYRTGGQKTHATIKYSSTGNQVWIIEHEGISSIFSDNAILVRLDSTGGIYVSGTTSGVSSGPDFLTVKYLHLVGINSTSDEIIKEYYLSQNFPNPFNPVTEIKYNIPVSGSVSLKIYDMLGREVKTLVNQFVSAGSYDIRFDGSNLANGVYFYKLQTEAADGSKFVMTKRMVLIK